MAVIHRLKYRNYLICCFILATNWIQFTTTVPVIPDHPQTLSQKQNNGAINPTEMDGDNSRKVLGSSVVTSVSVIMETNNGSHKYFADAAGRPVPRPTTSSQLASPVTLINPDRYEFYTFNDQGELVKHEMTLQEIQKIIAAGGEGDSVHTFTRPEEYQIKNSETRVHDVVANVQSVLKEEIAALNKQRPEKPTLADIPEFSSSWFGNVDDAQDIALIPDIEIIDQAPIVNQEQIPITTHRPTTKFKPPTSKPVAQTLLTTEKATTKKVPCTAEEELKTPSSTVPTVTSSTTPLIRTKRTTTEQVPSSTSPTITTKESTVEDLPSSTSTETIPEKKTTVLTTAESASPSTLHQVLLKTNLTDETKPQEKTTNSIPETTTIEITNPTESIEATTPSAEIILTTTSSPIEEDIYSDVDETSTLTPIRETQEVHKTTDVSHTEKRKVTTEISEVGDEDEDEDVPIRKHSEITTVTSEKKKVTNVNKKKVSVNDTMVKINFATAEKLHDITTEIISLIQEEFQLQEALREGIKATAITTTEDTTSTIEEEEKTITKSVIKDEKPVTEEDEEEADETTEDNTTASTTETNPITESSSATLNDTSTAESQTKRVPESVPKTEIDSTIISTSPPKLVTWIPDLSPTTEKSSVTKDNLETTSTKLTTQPEVEVKPEISSPAEKLEIANTNYVKIASSNDNTKPSTLTPTTLSTNPINEEVSTTIQSKIESSSTEPTTIQAKIASPSTEPTTITVTNPETEPTPSITETTEHESPSISEDIHKIIQQATENATTDITTPSNDAPDLQNAAASVINLLNSTNPDNMTMDNYVAQTATVASVLNDQVALNTTEKSPEEKPTEAQEVTATEIPTTESPDSSTEKATSDETKLPAKFEQIQTTINPESSDSVTTTNNPTESSPESTTKMEMSVIKETASTSFEVSGKNPTQPTTTEETEPKTTVTTEENIEMNPKFDEIELAPESTTTKRNEPQTEEEEEVKKPLPNVPLAPKFEDQILPLSLPTDNKNEDTSPNNSPQPLTTEDKEDDENLPSIKNESSNISPVISENDNTSSPQLSTSPSDATKPVVVRSEEENKEKETESPVLNVEQLTEIPERSTIQSSSETTTRSALLQKLSTKSDQDKIIEEEISEIQKHLSTLSTEIMTNSELLKEYVTEKIALATKQAELKKPTLDEYSVTPETIHSNADKLKDYVTEKLALATKMAELKRPTTHKPFTSPEITSTTRRMYTSTRVSEPERTTLRSNDEKTDDSITESTLKPITSSESTSKVDSELADAPSTTQSTWKLVPIITPHQNQTDKIKIKKPKPDIKPLKSGIFGFQRPSIHQRPPPPPSPSPYTSVVNLNPTPAENIGLEATTVSQSDDINQFVRLCNELAFKIWNSVTAKGVSSFRSVFISPFAATSMLAMIFLGARGPTSGEMNDILRLDDMVTFNPHLIFRNVSMSIEYSENSGVAESILIRELFSDRTKGKLLEFYKERARQFYDGHVEEVNFKIIGNIVKHRTNLLIRRQTQDRILDFIRGNLFILRPPLAAFSANIFETDCSLGSSEGRDGELHFIISPNSRQRRLVPIPAVVYRTGFLAGYEPELDATAVALGHDQIVSVVYVIPGQQGNTAPGDGLIRLEKHLSEAAFKSNAWSKLLRTLSPRPGLEVQIPRFSHRSVINTTLALQRMGLRELFNPKKADLRGLNGNKRDGLHLSDMIQINNFTQCGEDIVSDFTHHIETYPAVATRLSKSDEDILQENIDFFNDEGIRDSKYLEYADEPRDYQRAFHDPVHDPRIMELPLALRPRQARIPDTPRLRLDRPFLYFVRHNPTGLILHMGRFNPRLLP